MDSWSGVPFEFRYLLELVPEFLNPHTVSEVYRRPPSKWAMGGEVGMDVSIGVSIGGRVVFLPKVLCEDVYLHGDPVGGYLLDDFLYWVLKD